MIRDLGFICWKDENGWMEKMKGRKYEAMVTHENSLFKKQIELVASKEQLLEKAQEFKKPTIFFRYENIIIKEMRCLDCDSVMSSIDLV